MPDDPYEPTGVLPSLLRYLDRFGQVGRHGLRSIYDVATGDPASAGRNLKSAALQGVDILGDTIDAPLPGNLIPAATGPEDYMSGAELVGAGDMAPGVGRTVLDVGVGLATDPLTYLSFGTLPAAKAAATGAKGAVNIGIPALKPDLIQFATKEAMDPLSMIGRAADVGSKKAAGAIDRAIAKGSTVSGDLSGPVTRGLETAKSKVKATMGWDQLTAPIRNQLAQAKALGGASAKVFQNRTKQALAGLSQEERVLLSDAIDGVDWGSLNPRQVGAMVDIDAAMAAKGGRGTIDERIDYLTAKYGYDPVKLKAAAADMQRISNDMWDEGVAKGVYEMHPIAQKGRPDYLQRRWEFEPDAVTSKPAGGPSGIASAKLDTPQDIINFYNQNKTQFERDSLIRMAKRAQQQGTLVERGTLAKAYGTAGKTLSNDGAAEAVANINKLTQSGALNADEARRLSTAIQGMPGRGTVGQALATANRFVKPALVYGVIFPKVGSMVRNKVGMVWQAASTPGAGLKGAGDQLRTSLEDLFRSADDAYGSLVYGGKKFQGDDIGQSLQVLDQVYKSAKNADDVIAQLNQLGRADLADAVKHGVMDGFVDTERLIGELKRTAGKQKWSDLYDAPGAMFQAIEQRGRLREYLRERAIPGMAPDQAARNVKDAFLDYTVTGPENRALRDIIPFAQFIAQSIPQQAKLLSNKPWVGAAAAPLFYDPSGEQDPTYPWMQGKTVIPAGESSETGNPLYLSGFGLPIEALSAIPNLSADPREAGRDIQRNQLASMQPLVKTAIGYTTGEDPYFGTPFGTYSKLPIVGEAGAVGRGLNVAAGTGLMDIIPGVTLARQVGQMTQGDRPLGARIADVSFGAKLTEVDPDLAEQKVLTDYLAQRPEIKQYRGYYQQGEKDPELSSLLDALRESKKRSKEKRLAAAAAAP